MGEFLRNNWFIVIVAIIILSFISYFIYDNNKYNVSKKSSDGDDVVASVANKDVTTDDLYSSLSEDDGSLLYNMYRNAVVEQSIKTTDSLEEDAKELEESILSSAQSSSSDYEALLTSELANYGYSSYEELYDYCLMSVKEKKLNQNYVNKHFEDLKSAVEEKNPRTISIIMISVSDPDNITEDEQNKMDSIDSALESQSFGKTASQFSEDTTASEKGFYGYIDEDDASSSSSLDSSVIEAALELDKDGTSNWITVTDDTYGYSYMYKVHVDETDIDAIKELDNDTVQDQLLYAILNNNDGLDVTILEKAAAKLDIKFNDEDTEKKVTEYIESMKEGDEE